jgi:shikimate kinase/3-dehydroquinate synthase
VASFVALAGFMGSGKSSVGPAVARVLGCRYVDLDQEIAGALGESIAEYFGSHGEEAFRLAESQVLEGVLGSAGTEGLVLALGGGTLENASNRRRLKETCRVFLLDTGVEEAWARVAGSSRPLAQDESSFRELWHERRHTYEAAADWIVPTGKRPADEVVSEVLRLIEYDSTGKSGLWGRQLTGTSRGSEIVGGPSSLRILEAKAAAAREAGRNLHVVTDTNVMRARGDRVLPLLGSADPDGVYVVEAGEQSKSPVVLQGCWEWLAGRKARRDDVMVAFGGGVVGDLAGFVAATYHRGIGLWQVPTSLLAQVDSSIGGKTAINLSMAKNLVGTFYQPDVVCIDPEMLATLPEREYAGALGEVVKHALLSSECDFESLEQEVLRIRARDVQVVSGVVKRNVWFKAGVVQGDERERESRAMLNLGHTTAHAIEAATGYGEVSHGQAVALGILVALAVSEKALGLDQAVRKRTVALLAELGLQTVADLPPVGDLLEAAAHDKKVKYDTRGFVGLRDIGQPVWGLDVSMDVLAASLEVIRR